MYSAKLEVGVLSGSVEFQQTIARPAVCAGVGVHSGKKARLVLKPAPAGTGVVAGVATLMRIMATHQRRNPAARSSPRRTTTRNLLRSMIPTWKFRLSFAGLPITDFAHDCSKPQTQLFQIKHNDYRAKIAILARFVTRRNKPCFVSSRRPPQCILRNWR